jgi:penicillin-binding protein 2
MSESRSKFNRYDSGIFRRKFEILLWVISISLSLLLVRLWYLQVVRGDDLRQKSESNRIRIHEVKALRGIIYDRNGVILSNNQPSYDLSIVPGTTKDVQEIAAELERLYSREGLEFNMDEATIDRVRSSAQMKLERSISWRELALVETNCLDLPGVVVDIVPVRKQMLGMAGAHLLGYVNEISPDELRNDASGQYKPGDRVGKSGLEKVYDRFVRGVSGGEHIEVNAAGRKVRVLGKVDPLPGGNLYLTVDYELQMVAWDALEGKTGSVVAMDPRDGSVLALVSRPAYDPELFNKKMPRELWERLTKDPMHPLENKAIAGQYPPGSTFKMIMAIAGLEEGVITPDTKFNCNGSFTLGDHTFRCWQKKGHGSVNLHKAIVQSCDVYFYNVGRLLGIDKIAEYARAFGLGSPTGISLPGEKEGLVPSSEWKLKRFKVKWQPGETISASIGQGFGTVTPLQLVNAYAALANGGEMYFPRIVTKIESWDGKTVQEFPPVKRTALNIDKKTMEIVTRGLWGVCNEPGGTAMSLRRKEADVCGKTGTAQVISAQGLAARTMEYKYRDHALFVCFAPKDNPEIAIAVVVEHGGHGSSAAAPVARKLIDAYFQKKKGPAQQQQAEPPQPEKPEKKDRKELVRKPSLPLSISASDERGQDAD